MEPSQEKRKILPVDEPLVQPPAPVLRLRPTVPTELIRSLRKTKGPDGPLIAHPGLLRGPDPSNETGFPLDITMDQYRALWNGGADERIKELREGRSTGAIEITGMLAIHRLVDMQRISSQDDDEIALAVERTYVGAQMFVVVVHR